MPAELGRALEEQFSELEAVLRGVSLLRELSTRSMDALASHGERLSTRLFAALLASQGVPCALVDARRVVRTDDAKEGPAAFLEKRDPKWRCS